MTDKQSELKESNPYGYYDVRNYGLLKLEIERLLILSGRMPRPEIRLELWEHDQKVVTTALDDLVGSNHIGVESVNEIRYYRSKANWFEKFKTYLSSGISKY